MQLLTVAVTFTVVLILEILDEMLGSLGYDVVSTAGGAEAIEAYRQAMAAGVIAKPYTFEKLSGILDKVVTEPRK